MPPKVTVTRQQVLEAAFALLRTEGPKALTARRVAQELGCSTQPVYRAYGSMAQLKADATRQAQQVVMSYLAPEVDDVSPFLAMGEGSLRLARDEPHLFRLILLAKEPLRDLRQGKKPPPFVLERMRADPMLAPLSDEQLTRVHTLMWFFSQGLATLFFGQAEDDPMPEAMAYLKLAGKAVLEHELGRRLEG